jgi:dTDP-4-dehydrorhamnose reductase
MRIFVAGRNGQLSLALARALPAARHEVAARDLPDLDLSLRESVAQAFRDLPWQPDLVINAAAYTSVDKAEEDRDTAFAVNAEGAGWLAEEAAACGAPFLHVSTDYVFDGRKGSPYSEEDAPNPLGVYGASKLAGERAVMAANPRSIILRTAWVCSADGNNFVRTMLRLARDGREEVRVVADQYGAPTFAADLAEAILALAPRVVSAQAGNVGFGIFHLTGEPHTSWHGFAEAIFAGIAARGEVVPELLPITTAEYPTKAQRPADGRLDCRLIQARHGIGPADWRKSLGLVLDDLVGPLRD